WRSIALASGQYDKNDVDDTENFGDSFRDRIAGVLLSLRLGQRHCRKGARAGDDRGPYLDQENRDWFCRMKSVRVRRNELRQESAHFA
ncbi:MAG TPA: hypothetical protein VIX37_23250, partial [Candidatus Sulfotelmatobacter sp.]